MIKIFAPVDKAEEVDKLIDAGADELYCGLVPLEWLHKYTALVALTRRPALSANFRSFEDLEECVKRAHSRKRKVSLTINEHYYRAEQYDLLLKIIERAANLGVDYFIISDLGLLLTLRKMDIGVKMHMSIGGMALNSETVKFYQELGVSRVQLPRDLTIEEIRSICRDVSGIELGAFILNSKCANIDGFCTFLHFPPSGPLYNNACMLPYEVFVDSDEEDEKKIIAGVRNKVWERFHIDDRPCGACALYEFNEMGLDFVKIVGRGYPILKKVLDVTFIRTLLDYLNTKRVLREDFRLFAKKLYAHTYNRTCRTIMCYYPEVMLEWSKQYI
ncbi:MAG: U32 family peptidase [Candidatus Bathyarchaeia archaeon]